MAYGIFRKVTTLEFFQHHFAKSGHGDGLLMTRQLISTFRQPPLHYLTRSVRRTSGFVLAVFSGLIIRTVEPGYLPVGRQFAGETTRVAMSELSGMSRLRSGPST